MADFAALADRLITKNGRTIVLRSTTRTPTDADKPWAAATESETDTDTVGVFLDIAASDFQARVSAVSRLVIANVEVKVASVLIPGTCPVEPTTAMKIVDGDRIWGIARVEKIEPGDGVSLYIVALGN